MPVQTEMLNRITDFLVHVDQPTTPGSTTLTAAAAAGATSITVAAITSFAANEPIRIGTGEEVEVNAVSGTPTGNTINLQRALQKNHASGEAVVEQVAYRYMVPEATSTQLQWQRESADQFTADQRLVHVVLKGFGSQRLSTRFTGLSMYNLCLALGIPIGTLVGTGASATDPLALVTTGAEFGTLQNASIIVNGVKNDSTNIRWELWGVAFDYANLSIPISTGTTLAAVPLNVLCGGGGIISSAATLTLAAANLLSTALGTSGDVLQSLNDCGYMVDTTPATTLAVATTAGQTASFTVASGTGLAAGDHVRIDSGSNVEFKRIKTVATNTITLTSALAKAHASGVALVKVTPTTFAAIAESGVSLAFNGQTSEVRNAFTDMAIGLRYGSAAISAALALLPFNLATFARALGLTQPGGAYLPIVSGLGAVNLDGLYIRGTLQNAKTFYAILNGNQMDVSGVTVNLTTTGDVPNIPLTAKPSVSAEFMVYT